MDNIKESSGILKFLYNTVPGRAVLKVITSPTISKIGRGLIWIQNYPHTSLRDL